MELLHQTYSTNRLFGPDYNLQLGAVAMHYLTITSINDSQENCLAAEQQPNVKCVSALLHKIAAHYSNVGCEYKAPYLLPAPLFASDI